MLVVDVQQSLDDVARTEVEALVAPHGGERSLSDHLWLDLRAGGRPGFVAALGRAGGVLVAYAQLSATADGLLLGAATSPADNVSALVAVADAALGAVRGEHVEWWVSGPSAAIADLALLHGLHPGRRLLQMRCELTDLPSVTIETRPFRPGADEAAWLAVNNAAFAGHPEQGGWDLDAVLLREHEPWFEPEGFRVHEIDGRMVGFCWTKVHDELSPPAGEIYVIAVDPAFHGSGLGHQLTLAGLRHLANRGLSVGMLYVDAANTAAVDLYRRLGFEIHGVDQAYAGTAT
jgi:mycothiol synthase